MQETNTREIILLRELTAEERKVFELLKMIKGNNLMTMGIKYAIEHEDAKGFREMLKDLKFQSIQCKSHLEACIGKEYLAIILEDVK